MAGGRTASLLQIVAVALAVAILFSTDAGVAMALTLTSSAFQSGGKIPSRFTCEGADRSLSFRARGVPDQGYRACRGGISVGNNSDIHRLGLPGSAVSGRFRAVNCLSSEHS